MEEKRPAKAFSINNLCHDNPGRDGPAGHQPGRPVPLQASGSWSHPGRCDRAVYAGSALLCLQFEIRQAQKNCPPNMAGVDVRLGQRHRRLSDAICILTGKISRNAHNEYSRAPPGSARQIPRRQGV